MIGLTDFSSKKTVVVMDFKTQFGVLPNTVDEYGIFMPESKPHRNSRYKIPVSRFGFTIFYMKTWSCPDQTFFNKTNEKCEGCPVYHCVDCYNLTVCNQCAENYQLNEEGNICYLCDFEGCIQCSAPSECSMCNHTEGYVLLPTKRCQWCNESQNYFPVVETQECKLCDLI